MKNLRCKSRKGLILLFLLLMSGGFNYGQVSNSEATKVLKAQYPRYVTSTVRLNDYSLSPRVSTELKLLSDRGLATYNYIPPGTKGYGCYGQLVGEAKRYYIGNRGGNEFIMLAVARVDFDKITGIREIPAFNTAEIEYTEKIVEVTPVGIIYSDIYIGKTFNVSASFVKYSDGWRMEKISTTAQQFEVRDISTEDINYSALNSINKELEVAKNAEGDVYAPEEYWGLVDSVNALKQTIKILQSNQSGNYDAINARLEKFVKISRNITVQIANKINDLKQEIFKSINEAKASVNSMKASMILLKNLENKPISDDMLTSIEGDIANIESSVIEIQNSIGHEIFIITRDKANAINQQAKSLDSELTSASRKYSVFNKSDDITVNDIDGNTFKTITIGTQVWMAENLKTTKYNDGSTIPNVTDKTSWLYNSTGAFCLYNNDAVSSKTNGLLYNWHTVNTGKLCPSGWHVPSTDEWETMFNYLGGKNIAGGKLKETGAAHWINPNTGATNETGFTALPEGSRAGSNGAFYEIGEGCYWWSSTVVGNDAEEAFCCFIFNYENQAHKTTRGIKSGFSVRCIKD